MKKVLLATTALALSAGVAYAEVSVSGSANMGLKYNGGATGGASKETVHTDVSIGFAGSVETDGGLTVSAFTTLLTENEGAFSNDGTGVSVSGAFGKLSMGSISEADKQGGLADIGFKGIGIDDVAEGYHGAGSHNVGYTYSSGALSFAVSANVGEATSTTAKNEGYAVGAKYTFGSSYIGVGMNSLNSTAGATVAAEGDTTSIYAGTSMDAFSVNAMYSSLDSELAGQANKSAQGINVAYTTGAATISFGYSDDNTASSKAVYGAGVSYDLGGGAAIKAGVGKVRAAQSAAATATKADLGVSFSF